VRGPESFDAVPFLDLLSSPQPGGYGSAWGMEDRSQEHLGSRP
jgi:saccharopine dehydrogenase (NAD+, L-lysine-forming)